MSTVQGGRYLPYGVERFIPEGGSGNAVPGWVSLADFAEAEDAAAAAMRVAREYGWPVRVTVDGVAPGVGPAADAGEAGELVGGCGTPGCDCEGPAESECFWCGGPVPIVGGSAPVAVAADRVPQGGAEQLRMV